jgi:hypothetical protein
VLLLLNRIDLCVSGEIDIASRGKALSISRFGVPFDGNVRKDLIYRLRTAPSGAVNYPYLIVSDNIGQPADVLMIRDFNKVKDQLKKKIKKGTGLELTVNAARKMDSGSVGRWFTSLSELYAFCHSSRCQFILSSGARSEYEMISGPCLDAILKIVGIKPESHWRNMGEWVEQRLLRNVSYA